jgi:hypothetical protein
LSFPAFRNGGIHLGDNPICVWQVVSVHPDSVKNTFDYLNHLGHCPHFIWNPYTGESFQCLDLSEAGRLFSREVNQAGRPCVQVAVLADRQAPFTDGPLEGWQELSGALRDVGVPPVWPKGPPSAQGGPGETLRGSPEAGHYAVNQLDNRYLGVGSIDIRKLTYAVPN